MEGEGGWGGGLERMKTIVPRAPPSPWTCQAERPMALRNGDSCPRVLHRVFTAVSPWGPDREALTSKYNEQLDNNSLRCCRIPESLFPLALLPRPACFTTPHVTFVTLRRQPQQYAGTDTHTNDIHAGYIRCGQADSRHHVKVGKKSAPPRSNLAFDRDDGKYSKKTLKTTEAAK